MNTDKKNDLEDVIDIFNSSKQSKMFSSLIEESCWNKLLESLQ